MHGDIVEQLPQSDVRVVCCSVSSDRPGNPVPLVGKVPRKAGEEDPQAKEADSHRVWNSLLPPRPPHLPALPPGHQPKQQVEAVEHVPLPQAGQVLPPAADVQDEREDQVEQGDLALLNLKANQVA